MTPSFWDNPEHRPPTTKLEVGDVVEGRLDKLALESSSFDRARMQLVYVIDGQQRWATGRLWGAMFQARLEEGDRVRVERLPDEDRLGPGGHPVTRWKVAKITGDTPPPNDGEPDPSFAW